MGPESKIELTSGTLYLDGIECQVGTVPIPNSVEMPQMSNQEAIDIWGENVLKHIHERQTVEFEGVCKIKFRGLVMLLGFWPAVLWKIDSFKARLKKLWWDLRTPIEEDE